MATEQSIKQHCAQTRAAPLEIVTLTEMKHKDVYFPLREPQQKYAWSLISVNTKTCNYYILYNI